MELTQYLFTSAESAIFCAKNPRNAGKTRKEVLSNRFRKALPRIFVALVLLTLPALFADPGLVLRYGTYFGGSSNDFPLGAAADPAGSSLVVVGTAGSVDLPTTPGVYQRAKAPSPPNARDAFIAKFDTAGHQLLWCTYLGGNGDDSATATYVDAQGSVYVIGQTTSTNFPTSPGALSTNGVSFLSKITSDGRSLIFSTYLPPTFVATAMAVNSSGDIYLAGLLSGPRSSFVTPGSLNAQSSSFNATSLLHLNSTGSRIVYAAVLGGSASLGSAGLNVALDHSGACYISGITDSGNILTTAGSLQPTWPNQGVPGTPFPLRSAFILKVNASASQLIFGTYIGQKFFESINGPMAVDDSGSVYFSGLTDSTSSLGTLGAYLPSPIGTRYSGYIGKLTPDGSRIQSLSYLPTSQAAPLSLQPNGDGSINLTVANDSGGTSYLQLAAPLLGLVGPILSIPVSQSRLVIASRESIWLFGSSQKGSDPANVASIITADAFQLSLKGSSAAIIFGYSQLRPTIKAVTSAATLSGPFAPGQLVSIFGLDIGPSQPLGLQLDTTGRVRSTLGGAAIYFDGVPGPLFYVQGNQINTAIPFGLAGSETTKVVAEFQGVQSSPVQLALQAAAPGLFTIGGTGAGQSAVLNQDLSFNSPSSAAPRGSVITLFATGAGQTDPVSIDGQIAAGSIFSKPTLPVVVGIDNQGAMVLYAGQAPGLTAGVLQVNVLVPESARVGPSIPISIGIGSFFSQDGTTIAIK